MNKYKKLIKTFNLRYRPIALRLMYKSHLSNDFLEKFQEIKTTQRFSMYIKRVAEGELLKLTESDTSCISTDKNGHDSFSNIELDMKLNIRGLKYLLLFPADQFPEEPMDALILIINPFQFMKMVELYVELYKKPMKLTTGASTGVCSEIIAHVIKREDVNISLLCHGAREYAEFKDDELLFGIPSKLISDIIKKLLK